MVVLEHACFLGALWFGGLLSYGLISRPGLDQSTRIHCLLLSSLSFVII